MIITKITVQKNNQHRYNVFVDKGNGEEFGFSVDEDVLISFQLKKGMSLNETEWTRLLSEDRVKKALSTALNYLSYRMRTRKEIKDYLLKKEYSLAEIAKVLEKLESYNYVNHEEYAKAFVRSKKNSGVKGPTVIKNELKAKGIENEWIEEAIESYSMDEQIDRALHWIEKKMGKLNRESETVFLQNISRQLLAKGFSYEVIEKSIERLKKDLNNDERQWEALIYQGEKGKRKYAHLAPNEMEIKVKQWLLRRGFSYHLIQKYLQEHSSTNH